LRLSLAFVSFLPSPTRRLQAFQKYGHLDQSLFARFVRLGVPTVTLDQQGRARPHIAALYSWRYPGLCSLPATSLGPYAQANAGFALDFQLIDVRLD
jgi:intron-binding protein aquarius